MRLYDFLNYLEKSQKILNHIPNGILLRQHSTRITIIVSRYQCLTGMGLKLIYLIRRVSLKTFSSSLILDSMIQR